MILFEVADHQSSRDEARINSLNEKPKYTLYLLPAAFLDIRYGEFQDKGSNNTTSRARTEYYLVSPNSEGGNMNIGAKTSFGKSSVDISLSYAPFARVWKNPYITGEDRFVSVVNKWEGRLSYSNILSSGISVSYKSSIIRVLEDEIASIHPELGRSGEEHQVEPTFTMPVAKGLFISPGYSITRAYLEGGANSFVKQAYSIGANYFGNNITMFSRLYRFNSSFDAIHPIFGKKRYDNGYGISLNTIWSRPFEIEKIKATFVIAVEETNSNLNFFYKKTLFSLILINYAIK